MTAKGIAPDMSRATGPSAALAASVRRTAAGPSGDAALRAIATDNLAALTVTGQELAARARTLELQMGAGLDAYSGPRRPATRNMRMVSALFTGIG